jgi:ribosomal protein S18 acetylase RimI-like enzyme
MEENQNRNEKTLQGKRNNLIIRKGFDKEKIEEIAKACGADSVKKSISYISAPFLRSKLYCEVVDNVGFFAGSIGKKHFRLYELAVKKDFQHKGYGSILLGRIKKICREKNLEKITLRTSRDETAIKFYRRFGAKIVGIKDNDYEVEIKA